MLKVSSYITLAIAPVLISNFTGLTPMRCCTVPLVTCICIHWSQEVFTLLTCLCYFTHRFGFVLALPTSVPAEYVESWVMSMASVCIGVRCYSALSSALAFSLSWCHFGFFFAPLVWLLWLPKLLLPAHWFACSLSLTVRLIRHKLP